MTDAPQPPPGWNPPPPPDPGLQTPPGWAAPPPAPPSPGAWAPPPGTPAPSGAWAPPPGGHAYGYGYAPAGRSTPLAGIATAVSILLGLTAVAALASAGALFSRAALLDDPFANIGDLRDADDLVAATAGFQLLALIPTIVLWLIWQYRHAKNAQALGARGLGPGWAIGGWFIPVANLVLGPLQLSQSAKASDPDAPPGQGTLPAVVVLWWVLFALQSVLSAVAGVGFDDEGSGFGDVEEFQAADRLGAVGSLIAVAAAVAAILVVRRLSDRQRRALTQRGVPG